MQAGTPLGLEIKPIYDRGDLVPDELTVALIRERLAEPDAVPGFVLDGFPRNLAQAEALDSMLGEIGRSLDAILFFDLDDETATARALGRAHDEGRADDTPEGIARRLALYHEVTEPVVEYYRVTGKLVPLHAVRPIDAVWAEIEDALRLLDVEARA
jgi:adenylate kinase